ncbi:MAG: tetratricopeptide repeat protein [Dehalococcoidia bacterium]|nr:tetratricopeptide repeat protein [Dehalococcoidia bacterium]
MNIPLLPAVKAAAGWLLGKIKGRPTVQTGDRSLAAGGDQTITGQVATGDQSNVAGVAGIQSSGPTTVYQGLQAVDHDLLVRIQESLGELKESLLAPPLGAAPMDTEALAAQATDRTERLLAEAIGLQRQHKEREAIERLLTAYDMEMPPPAKAQLHILVGNGFLRLSELEMAAGHYRQALATAEETNDRHNQAAASTNLGYACFVRGDIAKAEEYLRDALANTEAIGDKLGQAAALNNLGLVYVHQGELKKAEELHRKALALHQQEDNREGQANALRNLGIVYGKQADLHKAEEYLRKALAISEEIDDKLGQAYDLGNLGNIRKLQADTLAAENLYTRSLALHEEIDNKLGQAGALGKLGLLAEQRGDAEKACQLLGRAAALYQSIGAGGENPETIAAALKRLGPETPD